MPATNRPRTTRHIATVGAALVTVSALAVPLVASADSAGGGPVLDRPAVGDLTQMGQSRRLRGDQTAVISRAIKASGAKNVIIVIGDGMGDSEITIGRNYLVGAGGFLRGLDALPLTGQMTHYSLDKSGKPDYVPDSAATGTEWATGIKTYDNAISVDIKGKPLPTILQLAKRTGRATGNVSTSEIQDATPAVLVANISQRKCYGPVATTKNCPSEATERGGPGSISEQLLNTRPDVTLGGGAATFAETAVAGRWQGKTLMAQAKERGYAYLTTPAELNETRQANQERPVLGLFAPGNLPVKFAPLLATAKGGSQPAARCTANPAFDGVPSLGTMTGKAIELLAGSRAGRSRGFFLQVESASIDKRDHAADACGQIGETAQIDDAVSEALRFARRDGKTLVIVTADHAHTSQIVDDPTPGLTASLRTQDGSTMLVSYGTAATGDSQQHTGSQLRVAGYGPGAANLVGLIDQTDLFFVMRDGMAAWDRRG